MLNYNSQPFEFKLETNMPASETPDTLQQSSLANFQLVQARLRKVIAQLERASEDSDVAVSDAVASFLKILEFVSQLDGTSQGRVDDNFATRVDTEVNRIMIAFQFQDLLKQRLAYAVTALRELCSELIDASTGDVLLKRNEEAQPPKADESGDLQDGETTIF